MSADPELAELLADRTGTVLLTQAATATEARLISERMPSGRYRAAHLMPAGSR